jgi:hypothetical protein
LGRLGSVAVPRPGCVLVDILGSTDTIIYHAPGRGWLGMGDGGLGPARSRYRRGQSGQDRAVWWEGQGPGGATCIIPDLRAGRGGYSSLAMVHGEWELLTSTGKWAAAWSADNHDHQMSGCQRSSGRRPWPRSPYPFARETLDQRCFLDGISTITVGSSGYVAPGCPQTCTYGLYGPERHITGYATLTIRLPA